MMPIGGDLFQGQESRLRENEEESKSAIVEVYTRDGFFVMELQNCFKSGLFDAQTEGQDRLTIERNRKTAEEQNPGSASVDDCLAMETRKALLHLKNPHISTISIWGWDGIGKSMIAKRIMEEAKKKENSDFDEVILVSVPCPVMPASDIHLQSHPQNEVPNIMIQRMSYFPPLKSAIVIDPTYNKISSSANIHLAPPQLQYNPSSASGIPFSTYNTISPPQLPNAYRPFQPSQSQFHLPAFHTVSDSPLHTYQPFPFSSTTFPSNIQQSQSSFLLPTYNTTSPPPPAYMHQPFPSPSTNFASNMQQSLLPRPEITDQSNFHLPTYNTTSHSLPPYMHQPFPSLGINFSSNIQQSLGPPPKITDQSNFYLPTYNTTSGPRPPYINQYFPSSGTNFSSNIQQSLPPRPEITGQSDFRLPTYNTFSLPPPPFFFSGNTQKSVCPHPEIAGPSDFQAYLRGEEWERERELHLIDEQQMELKERLRRALKSENELQLVNDQRMELERALQRIEKMERELQEQSQRSRDEKEKELQLVNEKQIELKKGMQRIEERESQLQLVNVQQIALKNALGRVEERERELQEQSQRSREEKEKELQLVNEQQTELKKRLQRVEEREKELQVVNEQRMELMKARQTIKERQRELQEQSQMLKQWWERVLQEQRRRELQTKIMAELKLNIGTLSSPAAITEHLANWLAQRRFLIIFADVWEQLYLKGIGVPLTAPRNDSKVILIPVSETIHKQMRAEIFLQQNFRSLSGDQAWKLLDAEARDAATALSFQPNLITSTNTSFSIYPNLITSTNILECFFYVSLFCHSIDATSLKEFWRSEGFFEEMGKRLREAEEQEEGVEELMEMTADAVLAQLSKRCMLNSFQGEFQMPACVWELVSSRKRFLIQCDSSSQVPQSDQWEGAERISLSHNQIQELSTRQLDIHRPLNCQRLLTLFLNDNRSLSSISDDFFKSMTSLQVLNLSATGIKFLPSSISCLCHLRMLKLRNCSNLEALPTFIKDLPKLEVLDIGQTSLPSMVEASFEGMPSLRILDISNGAAKNLTQLSVKDCRSLSRLVGLEGLSKLSKLIALDLSRTKIEWLPHQVFNLPGLKRLHLVGMEHLKMVEWNEIERLPEELNWHRQSKEPPLQEQPQGSNGRFSISASHDSVFNYLGQTSKLSNSYLQKFHFLICSCERGPKYRHTHFRRSRFRYSHFCHEQDSLAKDQRLLKYDRWVEVCGGKTSLNGLRGVLFMADFYCLRGNEFINTVFDEGLRLSNLRECWIEKCDQLESVFSGNFGSGSFSCLQHLYLQCCPKLVNIFSSSIQLKQLKLLEIKFCGRLENVNPYENEAGQDAFPELSELHLWELGKLKRICGGYLPKLKKLKIRGCPLLKQLPLNNDDVSAPNVEIHGEAAWWKSIKWEAGIMPKNILFQRHHCSFKG